MTKFRFALAAFAAVMIMSSSMVFAADSNQPWDGSGLPPAGDNVSGSLPC